MNIFILHEDPTEAAIMHCDKHCSKMIIEHAQMMASAYYSTIGISRKKEFPENQNRIDELFKGWPRKNPDGSDWPYSISHVNHPCTVWTRESLSNFYWLLNCTKALCQEFTYRYKGKHSVESIVDWMYENPPKLLDKGLTPFAQALPECFKNEDATIAYRRYYAFKTTYMKINWKRRERIPHWWRMDHLTSSIDLYRTFNPDWIGGVIFDHEGTKILKAS
jgi:hypothetical protein